MDKAQISKVVLHGLMSDYIQFGDEIIALDIIILIIFNDPSLDIKIQWIYNTVLFNYLHMVKSQWN